MRWDELRRPNRRRLVKSWEELCQGELRRMEKLRRVEKRRVQMNWEEMRNFQVTWEEMRTVVIRWEELRKGEKTWDGMIWNEVKKAWEDMRWDEMRWDGMGWHRLPRQWDAMNNFQDKLRRDEIRWNEKRDGSGMKSQEIVAAMHRRLARTPKRHSLCMPRLNFETSAPGLPRYYLHYYIYMGGVPKIGVPPNHPFIGGFSLVNHPAIGYPLLWKPPQRPPDGFFDGAGWSGRILSHLPEVQRKAKGMENKT